MNMLDRFLEIPDEDKDGPDNLPVSPAYLLTLKEWREAVAEVAALRARIRELEANIIEADAQSNIDKKPRDIHSAELALVHMAAMGAEAMTYKAE